MARADQRQAFQQEMIEKHPLAVLKNPDFMSYYAWFKVNDGNKVHFILDFTQSVYRECYRLEFDEQPLREEMPSAFKDYVLSGILASLDTYKIDNTRLFHVDGYTTKKGGVVAEYEITRPQYIGNALKLLVGLDKSPKAFDTDAVDFKLQEDPQGKKRVKAYLQFSCHAAQAKQARDDIHKVMRVFFMSIANREKLKNKDELLEEADFKPGDEHNIPPLGMMTAFKIDTLQLVLSANAQVMQQLGSVSVPSVAAGSSHVPSTVALVDALFLVGFEDIYTNLNSQAHIVALFHAYLARERLQVSLEYGDALFPIVFAFAQTHLQERQHQPGGQQQQQHASGQHASVKIEGVLEQAILAVFPQVVGKPAEMGQIRDSLEALISFTKAVVDYSNLQQLIDLLQVVKQQSSIKNTHAAAAGAREAEVPHTQDTQLVHDSRTIALQLLSEEVSLFDKLVEADLLDQIDTAVMSAKQGHYKGDLLQFVRNILEPYSKQLGMVRSATPTAIIRSFIELYGEFRPHEHRLIEGAMIKFVQEGFKVVDVDQLDYHAIIRELVKPGIREQLLEEAVGTSRTAEILRVEDYSFEDLLHVRLPQQRPINPMVASMQQQVSVADAIPAVEQLILRHPAVLNTYQILDLLDIVRRLCKDPQMQRSDLVAMVWSKLKQDAQIVDDDITITCEQLLRKISLLWAMQREELCSDPIQQALQDYFVKLFELPSINGAYPNITMLALNEQYQSIKTEVMELASARSKNDRSAYEEIKEPTSMDRLIDIFAKVWAASTAYSVDQLQGAIVSYLGETYAIADVQQADEEIVRGILKEQTTKEAILSKVAPRHSTNPQGLLSPPQAQANVGEFEELISDDLAAFLEGSHCP